MNIDKRLSISLLFLRLTVFLVMFMWTLDKFLNPEHTAGVYENFYGIGGLSAPVVYLIGSVQAVFVIGFLCGVYRAVTYGVILLLHAVSTFSSYKQYMDPFENLLFFAAWPMLAAAFALFLLRDRDTLLSLGAAAKTRSPSSGG